MAIQRQRPTEKRVTDDLIDRVMAADVLTNNFQFTVQIKNSRGMNSTGSREIALCLSQFFRERKQFGDLDSNISRSDSGKILPDRVDARLAAKPAAARNRSETLRGVQPDSYAPGKLDNHNVVDARGDFCNLLAVTNNRFGKQETSGELIIVSRCAHRGCHSFVADSNFERLFDRQLVAQILECAVFLSPDDLPRTDAVAFFHVQ